MHKVENKADPWLFYMKMCKMVAYGRYFRELHEMMAQGLFVLKMLSNTGPRA